MGSVKDPRLDRLGLRIYRRAEFNRFGLGAWLVSGRFSVGDLKDKIPPLEIANKDVILAMTSGWYWEQAAMAGFQSTYVGMMDNDGEIVDVGTLLGRGEVSSTIVMRLGVTPHIFGDKITDDTRALYHRLISSGDISVYVADAECIHRWGFPLGSSTFKRIFGAAGRADQYENLATYAETVAGLDEIRSIPGITSAPEMMLVLQAACLDCIPNPGHMIEEPAINFDTKFRPAGDANLSDDEAQRDMHLDTLRFSAWRRTVGENARHQHDYCADHGLVEIDGKTEAMVANGYPIFTDFACNIDENRIMIRHDANGIMYLIPANKEAQRATFRARGIYAAKEEAIREHGDNWLDYLGQYVSDAQIEDATRESVWMMEQAIANVGNALLGRDIFDAKPVEQWVGPFLPYASVLQVAA